MDKRAISALARKDMRAISANLQVWLPMAIVPLILGVLMPGGMVWAVRTFGVSGMGDMQQLMTWLDRIPPSALRTVLDGLPSLEARMVYLLANYMLAPFFLMIPLMTASVIAADSFVGEKERGTLETLLFAPVAIRSLFIGKVLAAFIPSMLVSLTTLALCSLTVNLAGWPLFGHLFFPQLNWLPLALLVLPMISLTAILFNVFISARVATFQAAYQLGGLVILPVLALLVTQMTGVLLLDSTFMLGAGLLLALLNLLLLRQVLRRLDRNLLFTSQVR